MKPSHSRTLVLAMGVLLTALGTLTVRAQTKPIVRGWPTGDYAWQGSTVLVQFDRSMDVASVEAAFSIEPETQGAFVWFQEDRELQYRPFEPLEAETRYRVTIDAGIRDARGQVVLYRPYSWTFSTSQASTQVRFAYGVPVQVVTPSGGRGAPIQPGYPRITLDFALYSLDLPTFADRYTTLQPYSDNKIDLTGLTLVTSWSAHIDATEKVGEVALPPGTAPGLYVLDARGKLVGDAQTLLVYSDYALVAKRGRGEHTVWVTTVPGGVPVAGATVNLIDEAGTGIAAALSNDNGIALFDEGPDAAFVTAGIVGKGGRVHTALVGLDNYWCSDYSYCGGWWNGRNMVLNPPEYNGHVHTDRPIYRPGQTVYYKATLRHIEHDGYSVIDAALPLTVTIKDKGNNVVYRDNYTADDFGSIAPEDGFRLGDDVALGDWRIEVGVGAQTFSTSFQVEEYVKPDYEVTVETDSPFYVIGETADVSVQGDYYFGQPAAGAEVVLRVFRGYYYYGRGGNQVGEYNGTLDDEGSWSTRIPLPTSASYTEMYYFEAEVTDASRRPVVNETSAPVHPAAFKLALRNQRYGVEVGQPIVLTASTMGHDGQPVVGREVAVEARQYQRGGYVVIYQETVTSGDDGTATVRVPGLTEGWYQITATAADDMGHRVTAYSYAWLWSRYRPWYWWGGLEINADRDSYAPGDTAQLLIKSQVNTTALITLERDEVYDEIVVEVNGATTVEVPIKPEYAPNVWAKVQLWQPLDLDQNRAEGQLLTAQTNLVVPAVDQHLTVAITPDADIHEPGEEATFTVEVTDADGNPVEAQLSFALVDKAVLALAADRSGDIFDAFWGVRSPTISTHDSLRPSQWYAFQEGDARGGRPPGGPEPSPTGTPADKSDEQASEASPRRYFPDTAYWKADIVTDRAGKAEVKLTLPDNLTTWKAMVRAVTKATQAGQGSSEMIVTKAVIADPALPRFAVQGDQFALDVLGRNYAGGTLDAICTLDTPGLVQLDPGAKTLQLPFNETHFARWTVVASDLGENPVTARLTTAGGDDAIELPLEVQAFAVPDRYVVAGSTDNTATEPFEVPFNAVPESSTVEVRLSPGMALGILDGLEELVGYPYGCIEQTMSRMLPNAVVGRLILELDIRAPEITDELPEMMALGLQKIYGFQNSDGSWGWWRSDGNIYITAYVLHGLTMTQQAGYEVDPNVLERAFTWLAAKLPGEGDPRIRAYAAYVMAVADKGDAATAEALFAERGKLDAFSLAALAVTLDIVGRNDLSDAGLDELVAMAAETPTTASWPMDVPYNRWSYYYWRSMASTEKNTAMALEALAVLRPESPLAPKAARWLLEHRWGRGWRSTQATAFAVLGLTDYIVTSGELWAEYDWQVRLDDDPQPIAEGKVDAANVTKRIPPIVLTGAQLSAGSHELILAKQGEGTLFYTIVARMALYYDGFEPTQAEGYGLKLTRDYIPIEGRSDYGGWKIGDVINVRLTIETTDELHYAIIEDMLPAGLEALNERLETESSRVPGTRPPWRWWGYERKEVHDERVTFFDTYLYPGKHTFEYAARAVTPGVFSARPAEAYAMYRPEVWGRSASDQVTIDVERIVERPPLAGDFNRDCRLTAFDASLVAADWPGGRGRDVNGDGRVNVADIATAGGRTGLACGDNVPLPPGRAGEMALSLKAPDEIRAGESFDLEVLLDGQGNVGAYEVTLTLPEGVFEVLGATAGDLLPGTYTLGPVVAGNTVRFGGYALEGARAGGETVVARLKLRAREAGDAEIAVGGAQIVTDEGGEYRVTADGTAVSPEPWTPRGRIYLPQVTRS